MKNDEQFDGLLRQKANSHEAPVPLDAWDNIIQKRRSRRIVFFWCCLAGVLLFGNAGYLMYKERHQKIAKAEPLQLHPKLAAITDKDGFISSTENKKATSIAGKEKTLQLNNGSPEAADNNERKSSSKWKVDEKKQAPFMRSGNGHLIPKNRGGRPDKEGMNVTVQKEMKYNQKNIDDTPAFEQTPNNNLTQNQLLTELGNRKIKAANGNLLEAKSGLFTTNVVEKDEFNELLLAAGKMHLANDYTASEKEVFTNKQQITESIVGERNFVQLETAVTISMDYASNLKPVLDDSQLLQNIAPANRKNWWVDISATPFTSISAHKTISQLNRTTQAPGFVAVYTASSVKISQEPGVVYAISVRKNVSNKWAYGIGVQYQQIKEKVSMAGTETHTSARVVQRLQQNSGNPVLVNDTIVSVTNGTRTIDALNSYTLVSLPIFAQYRLLNKTNWLLDWNIGGYFNISRKYSNSVSGVFAEQNNTHTNQDGQSKVGFDLFTEVRISNALTNNIFVFAAPGFRYNLSEYKMPGMFKYTFLHQAGVSLGLSLKF